MPEKLENLIAAVYKKYKAGLKPALSGHPDEAVMACFIEGRLFAEEEKAVKQHLIGCSICAEAFLAHVSIYQLAELDVAQELITKAKGIVAAIEKTAVLELILKLKDGLIELLSTNGAVLVGQELIPAPILRSRKIENFKDEVVILKDFDNIRVEARLEKKGASSFSLSVSVKDRQSSGIIKDLRITLLKAGRELESYIDDSGKVIFEHIALGSYSVEIIDIDKKLAAILLEIKA